MSRVQTPTKTSSPNGRDHSTHFLTLDRSNTTETVLYNSSFTKKKIGQHFIKIKDFRKGFKMC